MRGPTTNDATAYSSKDVVSLLLFFHAVGMAGGAARRVGRAVKGAARLVTSPLRR